MNAYHLIVILTIINHYAPNSYVTEIRDHMGLHVEYHGPTTLPLNEHEAEILIAHDVQLFDGYAEICFR